MKVIKITASTAVLLLLCGVWAPLAQAQSKADLQDQYLKTCSVDFQNAHPDIRPQCDLIKKTIDLMSETSGSSTTKKRANTDAPDGTTECKCERKMGRCSASTSLRSLPQSGKLSKYILRIAPPAGQCAEVTVYLAPQKGAVKSMIREPIYRVVESPAEVEWLSESTRYQILDSDTECYLCARKAARDARRNTEDSAAAEVQKEIRKSYETQYQQCLQGKSEGLDLSKLEPQMKAQICEGIRQQMLLN
nr:hypothetical protein [uncultured Duganella sp.]